MDKGERSAEKWRKQVEKSAAAAGKAIGAASAVAVGAGAIWIKSTVETANEIAKLAAVSNASNTEFQKMAYAAQTVGIEQDKLADIYKDVNDRVGEFLETGGGPMLDFFKNIAPYVGVTADQFRNLSGPQALGLYVKSLEKAGLSQQEMTFYLEAMASDTTSLIPLLRNGGKGMADLADQADNLGIILDDKTIKGAQQFNRDLDTFGKIAGGVGQKVAAELLPELTQLTTLLKDPDTAEAASKLAKAIVTITTGTIDAAKGTVDFMGWVGDSIAASITGPALDDIVRIEDRLDKLKSHAALFEKGGQAVPQSILAEIDELNAKRKVAIELQEQQAKASAAAQKAAEAQAAAEKKAAEQQSADAEKARKQREEQRKLEEAAAAAKKEAERLAKEAEREAKRAADEAAAAAKRRAEAIADEITNLEYQVKTLGMSTDQEKLFKLATEGATEAQLERAKAALATADAFDKQKKAQEDYRSLVSSLRTEEEQLTDQLKERLKIIESMPSLPEGERRKETDRAIDAAFPDAPKYGGIDASVGGPAGELMKVDDAQKQLEDWYATQMEMLSKFREQRADLNSEWDEQELELKRQHEAALANIEKNRQLVQLAAAESTFGSLAEMAKSYAGESSGIYKAMFAVEKGIAIARAAVAIQEGIALAAANPFPLNLAAMATVAAETASIVGNIAAIGLDGFEVGGYTGNGGIHDVAGFVHGKEFVFDAASTARIGVGNLEAMRSGKLDASINKASAAIAETNNDNRTTSINVTVALPGGGSTKEQRASGAKIGRQIARAVDAAGRYS